MHIRLRKKDYDFTIADAACNHSFSILRQREGTKKEAEMEAVNADTDDALSAEKENGVSQTKEEENGCDAMLEKENLDCEPCAKKQKLGPVSEEDLFPLKPKVLLIVLFNNKIYTVLVLCIGFM
jgi:hypothetical protein